MRAHDWSRTRLGAPENWPQSLRTVVRLMLNTGHPMYIFWGADGLCFYNDAYRASIGAERHPGSLGRSAREVWDEIWPIIGPQIDQVMSGGGATWHENALVPITRDGVREDVYWTYSYSPIDDEGSASGIGGVLVTCNETTQLVLAERSAEAERVRQREMLQQMPGFVCVLRGPEHVYEYINDAYITIAGARDFMGRTVRDVLPELEGQGFYELLDQVYASGERYVARALPIQLGGEDGLSFIDFVYEPIRNPHGEVTGIFVGGYDVTEVARTAGALAESESRYRTLFDTVGSGFCIIEMKFDGTGKPVDYMIVEGNSAFSEMTGLYDANGKWVSEIAPGLEQHWFDLYGQVALTGQSARFENSADVLGRWYDVEAVRIGDPAELRVAILFNDITAQKQAELRRQVLLDLNDAVRDLTDPADIAHASSSILAEALNVSRVGYGVMDTTAETVTIERDYNAPGVQSIAGVIHFRDFGSYIENLARGEVVVFNDAAADPRISDGGAALAGIKATALINLPLLEQGKVVALLFVNNATPRVWSDGDVALVREVAERVRTATERARATASLRESEAQFRAFAQAVPNHVWASHPDGRLYWFNQQVYAYAGVEEGALDGAEGWGEIVHPEDLQDAGATWANALATGETYHTEFRIRRADGAWRWFVVRAEAVRDAEGAIIRWVGANIDIDDIRHQGAELERVNNILSELLAGTKAERDRLWTLSEDMLARADYAGGLVAVNPAWTKILGWSEQELLTNPYADIISPDNIEATTAALVRMGETGQPTRFENRILSRDGQWTPIGWTVAPEPDGVHFIAVGRDLTEDKAREQQLMQAQEALRQSQKMEAVGQLTGGIAHDFNNLLAGISGSLELLEKRMGEGRLSGMERYISAAQGAARRAAALTQRLLAFSRRQTLDPKPVDVNRLIAGMEDLVRRSVGPDVEVEVVGSGGLWITRIDPSQLENALLNLCINSRDAMAPNGGRLTIETANKWLDERAARERDLPPGQYISLCVTDTGTGMSPEVQAQAFDPFFTTKPLGQGTGLGLSMIHGFVRQSGGQVRIYSEPGQGTTVCLYLPRHMGELDLPEEGAAMGLGADGGHGETVLVIDDEPTVRMLIVEVLEEAGYIAMEAGDGPSGLAILNSDSRIDLLITDVGLPGGLNGRQVADAARQTRPDLKVLFITGYAENAAVGNGLLDAGMQVITKPFAMAAMAVKVREMIET